MGKKIVLFLGIVGMILCCYKSVAMAEGEMELQINKTFYTEGSLLLEWDSVEGSSVYRVYRSEEGGEYIFQGETTELQWMDENIEEEISYEYRIEAVVKEQVENGIQETILSQGQVDAEKKTIVDTSYQKYTYEEMVEDIKLLADQYSKYCSYNVIGESEDGREIYEIVLGNPDAESCIGVTAAIHAREYMTSQLVMKQAETYLSNYGGQLEGTNVSNVLDQVCIRMVTMVNPDGVTISQKGIKGIKSAALRGKLKKMSGSTKRWKANGKGVDLNRNFTVGFRTHGAQLGTYRSEGFAGKTAINQSETKALAKWAKSLKNNYEKVGMVNYHATGSIIFGDCQKASLKKKTTEMYKKAIALTGYRSATGVYNTASNGGFREYHMYALNIPGITIEIGTGAAPVDSGEFAGVFKKNKMVLLEEAELFLP